MSVDEIFVVDAGLMGSGIAQNGICGGYTVDLNDQRVEMLGWIKIGSVEDLDNGMKLGCNHPPWSWPT